MYCGGNNDVGTYYIPTSILLFLICCIGLLYYYSVLFSRVLECVRHGSESGENEWSLYALYCNWK